VNTNASITANEKRDFIDFPPCGKID